MNSSPEEVLFQLALTKPAEKRAAFLDAMCDGDAALRQRLEALLVAHEQPATESAGADASTVKADEGIHEIDEAVGQTLGRYKLLEQIGEGGCGRVYVAEQKEPVRRKVALKVIKLGMDTKQVVARFEAERQSLAMMDHPNIAKVLDAGTTDVGRPYFVMELVRGIRITDYCDQANLSTKERLDLFVKICHAIQHAHQKGIIHRDIKPSNILVTLHDGVPVPKVIDFGIAKATQGELTDKTIHTQFQQFIGTPAYMSPEQAEMSGLDIDTRSDIYSLGVLLYELLTGGTPFDAKELMESGLDAMRKTIREKEPQRPSTRLATLGADQLTTTAKRRSADTSKLLHQIKGDLDWIVMKCLEKDRQRRYDTANDLAADLKRHLDNEPVTARPPSAAYRFQKLLRRNKVMAVATALVLTAILVGTVVSIGQTLRASRELRRALAAEAQALTEKANAQAALHFIQDDVLSQASPGSQPDRDLKVRALLDRISERLDTGSECPPLVEASLRQTLGSVYAELGEFAKSVRHYEGALRLQHRHLGENHLETLRSLGGLAMAHWWSGDSVKAEPLTRQGLEASRRTLGEKDPLTLQFMQARACIEAFLGEKPWTEVEPFFLRTLALHREVLGPDNLMTLRLIYWLAAAYTFNWQDAKVEPLVVDAVERSRRKLGEHHPLTDVLMMQLAFTYFHLLQDERAAANAHRGLESLRIALGEDHPETISCFLIAAQIYVRQEKFDEAEPFIEKALNGIEHLSLDKSPFVAWDLSNLGWQLLEHGKIARADALCNRAYQAMQRNLAANPLANPLIIAQLGAVRVAQERFTEAEPLLLEGFRLVKKHWPDGAYRFYVMSLLATSLAGQKNYAEARPLLLQSCEGLQQHQTSLPPYLNATRRITESLERLVQLYDAWDQPVQAAEWKQKLATFQQANRAAEKKGAKP